MTLTKERSTQKNEHAEAGISVAPVRARVGVNPERDHNLNTAIRSVNPSDVSLQPGTPVSVNVAMQERIAGLRRPYNWTGHGSKAVKKTTCNAALSIVNIATASGLPDPVSVAPLRKGAISIEWRKNGSAVAAEVLRTTDDIYYQWVTPGERANNATGTSDELLRILQQVFLTS